MVFTKIRLKSIYKKFIKTKGDCKNIKGVECFVPGKECPFEGFEWSCDDTQEEYDIKLNYCKEKLFEILLEEKLKK